jgi:hypothetical protein
LNLQGLDSLVMEEIFRLNRGIYSFDHKMNFLLGHTMMREAKVLNFEGQKISGSKVARLIVSALRPRSCEVKKDNRD